MIFESPSTFFSKLMFFTGFINDNTNTNFPKTLSKEKERELIERKSTDKKARDDLITHNLRLVSHIVKKFAGADDTDDLISIGTIGLIKAVDTYNPDKATSLSTYSARCIENEILMHLRSLKKHSKTCSLEDCTSIDKDGEVLTLREIIPEDEKSGTEYITETSFLTADIKKIMQKLLNDREYEIVSLRYGLKGGPALTQREVAKRLNISRSYVSRIEKKALEEMREEAINTGLYIKS